ncbi:MAG: hypothetical protein KJ000_03280 [Pirellulaceae bacterium]|nr:hypothetical protein [Pirellulaceae bacterium]
MDEIKRQVNTARRRLIVQRFLLIAAWSLFATLCLAAIGLAIPKIWVLGIDREIWTYGWIGGSIGLGLLVATVWSLVRRASVLDAAIEIDRRFQLKERVSSALALHPDESTTEIGEALIQDAVRRVERIDVRDSFPIRGDWRALLPLAPALAIFVLVSLVPDATPAKPTETETGLSAEAERVSRSAQELKKRLARAEAKAQEKGLEDTDLLFKQLQEGLEDLADKSGVDRKAALAKMNDLAKSLEKRRDQLGGADQMRNQLNRLKDIQQGPADKIAQAMKDGDFQKALDEMKNLQDKLKNNDLTAEEKEQLAKQLEQLRDKLQEMVDGHEQAKRDLQEEIQRRQAAGDLEGAGKMQRQLDQLNQMNDGMERMQRMADSLNQCKECLQNGQGGEAAAQLDQLAQDLQQLQDAMDQLETLNEIMDDIAMAKDAMACEACNGQGCEGCMGQGFGQGQGQGQGQGDGLGDGQGQGDRPEERTDTSFYESQVRGEVRAGAAVVTGTVGGPNRSGRSLVETREEISGALRQDPDPLIDVRLPKTERDQTKQYFERLRDGN